MRRSFDSLALMAAQGVGRGPDARDAAATPGAMPDDPALLRQIIAQQQATIAELTHANQGLHYRLDLLLRRLYGPSAERIDPQQLLLFGLRMNAAPTPPE